MNILFSRVLFFLITLLFFTTTSNTLAQWLTNGSNIYFNNGKVGIGTQSMAPNGELLTVNGTIASGMVGGNYGRLSLLRISDGGPVGQIFIDATNNLNIFQSGGIGSTIFYTAGLERIRITTTGNVGIGTASPATKVEIRQSVDAITGGLLLTNAAGNSNGGFYKNGTSLVFRNAGSNIMTFLSDGNVGIGTNQLDKLLTVNGTIHAKEVIVDLNVPQPDFVFEKDYDLMPLNELEAFVKVNKHLPEISSEAEVKQKGVSLGETQSKLLQKIEELTLYVIEQNKLLNDQNKRIEKLEKENEILNKIRSRNFSSK